MANKIYYQEDCNLSMLEGQTIAVIGYGSQGHAHALNAKESGCNVIIGLYEGSKSWAKAEAQGLKVYTAAEAAKQADIIMILINDELQADMYKKDIEPNLNEGDMLMFAHGFNIHFGCIKPPKNVDRKRQLSDPSDLYLDGKEREYRRTDDVQHLQHGYRYDRCRRSCRCGQDHGSHACSRRYSVRCR